MEQYHSMPGAEDVLSKGLLNDITFYSINEVVHG